ncbi:MAG: 50S ribosomal protein L22 [Desulfitobacteriaceae bacterium]|nr:50S ribosomal protein L22 [Desulfitobacteriaceae bacterium]MDD4346039.1 50S ribosomal protein L22 [Desulfitobacteriaceae bacterium]MDD4401425.1 50S ribosomal protein L22 [Desulfitobacteriaceae bacterium]
MQAKAVVKYVRISPRKVRQVINLIRGKKVSDALAILKFTPHGSTVPVTKVLKSAVANAEHNLELVADNLFINQVFVNEGPTLKRIKARAMGRADQIRKRTSHITVVVGEKKEG